MGDFFLNLFETEGFPARWQCGAAWQESPGLGYLHIVSDLLVWGAYVAIPIVLAVFVVRRKDLPFPKVVWLFVAFIFACGTSHLIEAIIFQTPVYRLAGLVKALTAAVSWGTVFALIPIAPKVLAMRSPQELEHEIAERRRVEAELLLARNELEQRVRDRTAELAAANAALEAEVAERRRAEERLARQAMEARLLYQATALAARTDSLEQTLESCVSMVCETTGWPVGHVYVPSADGARLEATSTWHLDDVEKYAEFRAVTEATHFAPGEGLPGQIWQSQTPAWISDVHQDPNFPRRKLCQALPIRGAFGFPLMSRGDVVAVLEFFTEKEMAPDEDLLVFVGTLGEQVGRVLERKRADQALRESEQRFRVMADSTPVLVWMSDLEKKGVYFNRPWLEFTGRTLDDELGDGWIEGIHPDDRREALAKCGAAFAERRPFRSEFRLRRHDGEYRWVLDTGIPRFSPEGAFSGYIGSCVEIHDQKRTEERYRAQSQTLATLSRVNASLAGELDQDRLVQAVTDAGTQLTGAQFGAFFYNVVDACGESYMLYTLSGVPREAFANFPMPRATELFGPTFRGEGIIRLSDVTRDPRYGRNAPYAGMPEGHLPVRSYLAAPVMSHSGEVLGGLFFGHAEAGVFDESAEELLTGLAAQAAVALDNARLYRAAHEELAERKRAEEALVREHAATELERSRLRAVLDALPVAVHIADASGRIVDTNPAVLELWGVSEPPRGTSDYTRKYRAWSPSGQLVEPHEWGLARALATGESCLAVEMEIESADGRRKTILDYALPIRDRDGTVTGGVAVKIDITERKRTERVMAFLAEASNVLASSLDYNETLAAVARLAVAEIADWCAVDVVEEDGTLQRLATAHVDPAKVQLAREFHRRYPPDPDAPRGGAAVLRTGQPDFMTEIPDELIERSARDDEHRRVLHELGLRSYICVPLSARGRTMGVLTFVSAESGRRYTQADLEFAREVARRAGMAVDNAHLYRAAQRELAERKRSEEQLRDSQERLRFTLDAVHVGTWDWNIRTNELQWSDNLLEIHGLAPSQFDGTFNSFLQDVRADDRNAVMEQIQRSIRDGSPYHVEYRLDRADGTIAWVEGKGRVIHDEHRQPIRMAGVCSDVTERKRAEEALARLTAESERQRRLYETIFASIPDLVYVFDLDHRFTYANRALLTMWGRTAEDALGKNCLELGYPDWHAAMHDREIEQVKATKQPIRGEVAFTGALGRRIYDYIFVPVIGADGEVEAVSGTTRDVTERKQAEQLQAGHRLVLQLIAEDAPLSAVFGALAQMLERQSEDGMLASILLLDADGIHLRHGAAPSLPPAYIRAIDGLAIGPSVGSCGTAAFRRQPVYVADIAEDPLWADFRDLALSHGLRACWSTPILSLGGQLLGTLAMYYPAPRSPDEQDLKLVDVATRTAAIAIERKRAEEALQKSNQELLQKNREMAQFVYIVSHDLKSPLVTLTGFVGLLREDLAAGRTQEAADSMDRIDRATRRMGELIDDLLELSRVGRVRNEPELVPIATVVHDLREQLASQLRQAGATLEIEEPLPPAVCDRARITEVFDNLLTNAIKYGCDGEDRRIVVGFREAEGRSRYFVRDFGRGIEPQYLEKVFGLFQRLDTRREGTGVGLAIVRRIMEVHGGRAWVESALGAGATFWIELPDATVVAADPAATGAWST